MQTLYLKYEILGLNPPSSFLLTLRELPAQVRSQHGLSVLYPLFESTVTYPVSILSASLVLHGSWWGRLPFKEQPSPWDPQTLFVVVKVPFHTFLITPESLDTNAMQDTLLILSYPLLSLHIEFFFLDTMLYVSQIVSYSNRWDVFCSPPQPTWWETETQGG